MYWIICQSVLYFDGQQSTDKCVKISIVWSSDLIIFLRVVDVSDLPKSR